MSERHRIQIIHWLAEFVPVTEIKNRLKEQFNVDSTIQAIDYYAPPNIPEKWRSEFDRHRAAYLADIDSIDLRHRKNRLKELVKLYREIEWHDDKVLAAGNTPVKDEKGRPIIIRTKESGTAAKILEQIAKEVGDAQDRRSVELTGANGGPVQIDDTKRVVFYIPDNGRDKPKPDEQPPADD